MPAQLRASSEGKHSHLPKVHRHAAFGTRCWHCKTWLHSPWEPKNFKLCSNKFQLYIQETTYYMALHWKKFLGFCQILKYCELLKYQNLPQVVHTLVEGQNFMKKSTMGGGVKPKKSHMGRYGCFLGQHISNPYCISMSIYRSQLGVNVITKLIRL